MYIISLVLSDILQALFTMPQSVGTLAKGDWRCGNSACYFMVNSTLSQISTSTFTMTIMALNRYCKIVKPAKHQNIFTKKFVIVLEHSPGLHLFMTPSILTVFAFGFDVSPHPGLVICKIELKKFGFPFLVTIFQNALFFSRHVLLLEIL